MMAGKGTHRDETLESQGSPGTFGVSASTSFQERRPRTLKHDRIFGVFDHNGDILADPGSPEGLFLDDTRHLSRFELTINGHAPMLLSSTVREDNLLLTCDLTNPDIEEFDSSGELRHDLIHIRRSRYLWQQGCWERISLRNYDTEARNVSLRLQFACDFVDLFEVRGTERKWRGDCLPPVVQRNAVTMAYEGRDGARRDTLIQFSPEPTALDDRTAEFRVRLPPDRPVLIHVHIQCNSQRTSSVQLSRRYLSELLNARRQRARSSGRACAIVTSNDIFNEAIRRSVADLYMLTTETEHGPYPFAGVPWFSTVFGRDAIISALHSLWLDPAIAQGVLRYLAANQATSFSEFADAEPGKILHEERRGEMAALSEVPFRKYYGSIDSTPLFVLLAGAYFERTNDLATIEMLWSNIDAALTWIADFGDRDGDGFVEYARRGDAGLINQGWKDSHDSIVHADGTLAEGPIALVEVQAYVYGAWRAGETLAKALGREEAVTICAQKASALREKFDQTYYDEELRTYVLALDGKKQPCRVAASNAGHVLFTELAEPERISDICRRLMHPSSYSGWGIRTLSLGHPRYNPMSYHNGSVWPHDNAIIAAGLARYGLRREVARIFEGMFAACSHMDFRRLPELFCGFERKRSQAPTSYPVACSPQAWAATALISLLQSCLGMKIDGIERRVTFNRPILPEFLREVLLQRIVVGGDSVDIAIRRTGEDAAVEIVRGARSIEIVAVK